MNKKIVLANTLIRTGGAILAVPDPIPVVDEAIGVGLVGIGAGIHLVGYLGKDSAAAVLVPGTVGGAGRRGSGKVPIMLGDLEDELGIAVPYLR